jgi:chaperone required for assembly of F1-ATPase
MKRFYKAVTITPAVTGAPGTSFGIALDDRPVRTPARALLALPNIALAEAVAEEWRAQGIDVDPWSMPLTGLANAAIDRVAPDPSGFAAGLALYGESELLCYRAGEPPALVARQAAIWGPMLDWAAVRFDVSFTLVTGIMHQPQPARTLERLAEAIAARTPWELAALSPIVTIAGSLVIALALAEGTLDPDAAFDAAHLDELWQAEQWGEDWMAAETRAAHRADFNAACTFLNLVREAG